MSALPKTLGVHALGLAPRPQRAAQKVHHGGAMIARARPMVETFEMEDQKTRLWCWAAVAVSLARFYGDPGWTQCRVVKEVLKRDHDCCDDPVPPECNTPGDLEMALRHVGCHDSAIGGAPPPSLIAVRLDAGHPVAVEIAWEDGGAHYVVIHDQSASGDMLLIADSLFGPSIRSAAQFPHRYSEVGIWLNTYFTRPSRTPGGES